MHTRAEFKATRELLGLTQQALADELGVQVRSVKRWERNHPKGYYEPPQYAWDVLEAYKKQQDQIIAFAVSKVEEIEADADKSPSAIKLTYWLSETDYVQWSTDFDNGIEGNWRMANANTRAAALVLKNRGYVVEFVNGAGEVVSGAGD